MENVNYGSNRNRVTYSRDFPPGCGCGNSNLPFKVSSDKKSVHHFQRDFPPGCGLDGPKITQFGGDSSNWRRVVGAVRSRPVMGDKEVYGNVQNLKGKGKLPVLSNVSEGRSKERENGVDLMNSQIVKDKGKMPVLSNVDEGRSKGRENGVDLKTSHIVKDKGKMPVLSNVDEGRSKGRENGVDLKTSHIVKDKGKMPVLSNVNEGRSKERESGVELKKAQNVKERGIVINNSGGSEREKVVELLSLFRKRCSDISRSGKGVRRVDTTAYSELKNEGKIVNRSAVMIGCVPGVDVGDKFHYRIELLIVGLHKQTQGGIDSMEWRGGRIATSIVANERHLDNMTDPNALTYIGEGGVLKPHEVGIPPDQELKGGNRALCTSWKEKRPVRVIRGLVSEWNSTKKLYVYDGLYEVGKCDRKKGPQGNLIFEFQLARCGGQPAISWQECRKYRF